MMRLSAIGEQQCKESNFKVFAVEVDEHHTDIVLGEFLNQYLLIVTQYGKIGSLLKISEDQIINEFGTDLIFSVKHVFGTENSKQQAAARYIAEKVNMAKPLIVFLYLKNYERKTVLTIVDVLHSIVDKNNSMPARISVVIKAKGGLTKY